MELSKLENQGKEDLRPGNSGINWLKIITGLFIVLVTGGALSTASYYLGEEAGSSRSTNVEEVVVVETPSPTLSPTEDFCAPTGRTDDQVRATIAASFSDALTSNSVTLFFFENFEVTCLPSGMFAELTEEDLVRVGALKSIFFEDNGIQKVHENAFEFGDLTGIETLLFSGEAFQSLPEGVFKGLTGLKQLSFNDITFDETGLDQSLFGDTNPALLNFQCSNCELTKFPEMIEFIPSFNNLDLIANTLGLSALRTDVFVNSNITTLCLGNNAVELANLGGEVIAQILDLGDTEVVQSTCPSIFS